MQETDHPQIRPEDEESFLSRWSRRKSGVVTAPVPQQDEANIPLSNTEEVATPPALSDADMPPIESLNEDSDYSGFFSPEVSEELRKLALRKLFRAAVFNRVDGLDDYDEDFTSFEPMGDLVTADMKHQLEVEARRKLERTLDEEEHATAQDEPAESGPEDESVPEQALSDQDDPHGDVIESV